MCKNSVGVVSDETVLENHPFVSDVAKEMERLKKQKEESEEENPYKGAFDAKKKSEKEDD